jgi:hypothetical protein
MLAPDEIERKRRRFGIHGVVVVVGALACIVYTRVWLDSAVEPCRDWICVDFSSLLAVSVWTLFVCANLATLPALLARWKSGRKRAIAYVVGLVVASISAMVLVFGVAGDAISRPLDELRTERWHRRLRESIVLNGWYSAVDPDGIRPFVAAEVTAHTDMDLTFSALSSALSGGCFQARAVGRQHLRRSERGEMRAYFECSQAAPVPIDMLAFQIFGMRGTDPEAGVGVDFSAEQAFLEIPSRASDIVLPLPPEQPAHR